MNIKEAAERLHKAEKMSRELTTEITDKLGLSVYQLYDMVNDLQINSMDPTTVIKDNKGSDAYYAMIVLYWLPINQIPSATKEMVLELGPFVPSTMLALRETKGISFNDWKRTKDLRVLLGRPLEHLLELRQGVNWTPEKTLEIRNALRYNSSSNFHSLKATKSEAGQEFVRTWGIPTNPMKGEGVMSAVPGIILQWWQARPETRIPGRMILDPYDWEKTPEALEITDIAKSNKSKMVLDKPEFDF